MTDTPREPPGDAPVKAIEARRLRLLAGKPLAEVNRLYRLESADGTNPDASVPWSRVEESVDYSELQQREEAAGLSWPPKVEIKP